MSLKTHKFARKPFYVDAVRVSEANIEEVAKWCEGTIKNTDEGRFIEVKVHRPLTERQTHAFIGDWVLFAGSGFKVYVPKAFDKSFEKVKTLTKAQADEAGIRPPIEGKKKPAQQKPSPKGMPKKRTAREITTNVGRAIREAQEAQEAKAAKAAEEPKVIENAEIQSISLDKEPNAFGESIVESERREKEDDLLKEVLRQPLPGDRS